MKQTLKRCAQNLSLSVISYPLTLCKPICTTSSHAKHYFLVSFFKAQGNLLYAGEKSVCCLEIFLRKIGFLNFCYTTDKFRLITTEQSSSTATLPNSEIHVYATVKWTLWSSCKLLVTDNLNWCCRLYSVLLIPPIKIEFFPLEWNKKS